MDVPLNTSAAWSDGVWLRTRTGPRQRGNHIDVSVWHRVRDLDGYAGRVRTVCGYGPRDGFSWPSGGSRWEIARPQTYGTLPGAVCERCRMAPARIDATLDEQERDVPDVPDIEELARLVAARLSQPPDPATAEASND